ncbi:MAG: FkbM family methyltransferase [Verrucomicrobiota bacterium]
MNIFKYLPESFKEKVRHRAGAITENARLQNLRHAGFNPQRIIDAGAYLGTWSQQVHQIFPEAKILLIEPQPSLKEDLQALAEGIPGSYFCACAVGAAAGEVLLYQQHSNSRIISPESSLAQQKTNTVEMRTLANLCQTCDFPNPDLIKLDLQGSEMAALKGAGNLWGNTEVFIVESSWLPIGTSELAYELIHAMHKKGYRLYDVYGMNYRQLDNALWQTDFIFVQENSQLISNISWD